MEINRNFFLNFVADSLLKDFQNTDKPFYEFLNLLNHDGKSVRGLFRRLSGLKINLKQSESKKSFEILESYDGVWGLVLYEQPGFNLPFEIGILNFQENLFYKLILPEDKWIDLTTKS